MRRLLWLPVVIVDIALFARIGAIHGWPTALLAIVVSGLVGVALWFCWHQGVGRG
jgi:UPF0716 family protein affecting phage T7 exclusion